MALREATPDEIAAGSGPLVVEPIPQDDWYTAEQLMGLGYKPEVLEELFGPPTAGPEGLTGWTVSSVRKIEQTVIAPAALLVERIFSDEDAAADLLVRDSTA
ncbi:hypothetical protein [Rhodococcus globerulus]|uniref:hypothetical protein n=1 Tax=Rhodococcus globerulus TaxID=33008 RepID=UPI000525E487|nr:hypothetical protein [Rhodococcus globerulus]PVX59754.1 hypothetical protein C8E04_6350 [Rhodococcus globerulus]